MKSEYKRVVTQASEEQLARWILKNMIGGADNDENAAFLTTILLEHRRQIESKYVGEPVAWRWKLKDQSKGGYCYGTEKPTNLGGGLEYVLEPLYISPRSVTE